MHTLAAAVFNEGLGVGEGGENALRSVGRQMSLKSPRLLVGEGLEPLGYWPVVPAAGHTLVASGRLLRASEAPQEYAREKR